jgi:glycine C-acetyltransferase
VFPSGYSANVGTLSALAGRHDTIVVDKYNHMSIVDGVRLSGAHRKIYQHNDMADLERVLERGSGADAGTLIVADGVFSMHGDICNLPEIVRLARAHGARVLIDDAHATGVLGARGSGTAEHFGMKGQVDLELGTMSKALAGMGGFVAGDEDVIEYLRFYANSYVFAATIPAGVAAGLIAAIDVLESEPERLQTLWSNIRLLRSLLLDHGFDTENSDSAVIPIVIRDERKAMEMGRAVRARGLFCQTVVYPGVALGDARLRVSVTCEHTEDDLRQAAAIFAEAAAETGAPRPGATARAASS